MTSTAIPATPTTQVAPTTQAAPTPPVAIADWELWSTHARLVVTDPAALLDATALAQRICADIDRACSRFRPDSELSLLAGRLASGASVSQTLAALVDRALAAAALTEGAVDPTLGARLSELGYDRDIAEVRARDDHGPSWTLTRVSVDARGRRPHWRDIRLDGSTLTVPDGVVLDLGATAKAVAADWCAQAIADEFGCGVLVSLGGDIATAGEAPEGGWQIDVQDTPDDPADRITLADGWALATSSTRKRRWQRSGDAMHHILDPQTLLPATPVWRSVTVAAPTCELANTLTTAAIVQGMEAPHHLARHGVAARLVAADGSVHLFGGWPERN